MAAQIIIDEFCHRQNSHVKQFISYSDESNFHAVASLSKNLIWWSFSQNGMKILEIGRIFVLVRLL